MADEAIRIGPPVATESYLNMDAVLDAVEKSGAQAVSFSLSIVFISVIVYTYV